MWLQLEQLARRLGKVVTLEEIVAKPDALEDMFEETAGKPDGVEET